MDTAEPILEQTNLLQSLQNLVRQLVCNNTDISHCISHILLITFQDNQNNQTRAITLQTTAQNTLNQESLLRSLDNLKPDDADGNQFDTVLAGFLLLSAGTGLAGAHLGAAAGNDNWDSRAWNYTSQDTKVGIVVGGANGVFLPLAYFYVVDLIGVRATLLMGLLGAYLSGAAANESWNVDRWNDTSPVTYNAIYEGLQNGIWFVEAIYTIHRFAIDYNIAGVPLVAFYILTYGTGSAITYHYLAQFHGGNYNFLQWNRTHEPGAYYRLMLALDPGTRLPTGFAEVALEGERAFQEIVDNVKRDDNTLTIDQSVLQTINDIKNRNRGAILWAWLYAYVFMADENQSLDWTQWDYSRFSTSEQFLNGIYYGKDLPIMLGDVFRSLRQPGGSINDDSSSGGRSTRKVLQKRQLNLPDICAGDHLSECDDDGALSDTRSRRPYQIHRTTIPPPVSSGGSLGVFRVPPLLDGLYNLMKKVTKRTHRFLINLLPVTNIPRNEVYRSLSTEPGWNNKIYSRTSTNESFHFSAEGTNSVENSWLLDYNEIGHCKCGDHTRNMNPPKWDCRRKFYDNIDGQILLGRIIIHFASRFWRAILKTLRTEKIETRIFN